MIADYLKNKLEYWWMEREIAILGNSDNSIDYCNKQIARINELLEEED